MALPILLYRFVISAFTDYIVKSVSTVSSRKKDWYENDKVLKRFVFVASDELM